MGSRTTPLISRVMFSSKILKRSPHSTFFSLAPRVTLKFLGDLLLPTSNTVQKRESFMSLAGGRRDVRHKAITGKKVDLMGQ